MAHGSKAFKIQGHQEVVFDAEVWKSVWAQLMRALQRCFAFRDKDTKRLEKRYFVLSRESVSIQKNALLTPPMEFVGIGVLSFIIYQW